MNYEEKITKFEERLKSLQNNAHELMEYYRNLDEGYFASEHEGARTAFGSALKNFREIFGASERSGVGENEHGEEICTICGTPLPKNREGYCNECIKKTRSNAN